MSKFTFQFKAGDFAVTTAATGHFVAKGVKVQILNQSNVQDYCVQDLSDTPYGNGRWYVADADLVPFVETEETGSMSKLQFKAGDFAVTIKDIKGSEVFIKKGAKVEIVRQSSSEGYLVQDLSKEVLLDGRWWVKDRNLVPFVEPESKFKYEWQVGDKIKRGDTFLGTVLAPSVMHEPRSFLTPSGDVDGFNMIDDWPSNLKPKGKKTKARYQAAKRAWEAEQVKETPRPVLPVGSYAITNADRVVLGDVVIKKGSTVKILESPDSTGMYYVQDLSEELDMDGQWGAFDYTLEPCEAPRPVLPVGSYAVMTETKYFDISGGVKIAKGAKVKILREPREYHAAHPDCYYVQDLSEGKFMDGAWHVEPSKLEPLKTVWDLQEGDECYWLSSTGSVTSNKFSSFEVLLRDRGNLYLTREEAEAADAERVAAVKESR